MAKDSKVVTRSRNKKETKKEELSRMRKKNDFRPLHEKTNRNH